MNKKVKEKILSIFLEQLINLKWKGDQTKKELKTRWHIDSDIYTIFLYQYNRVNVNM